MTRKVTVLTRRRAFATIKVVASAVLAGDRYLTYAELARRFGMPIHTGRGLGTILDEAAAMCAEYKLPDVSSVIVTKENVERGEPFPSTDSFVEGVWPLTGLAMDDIPEEQERVRNFDWRSVRSLGLS